MKKLKFEADIYNKNTGFSYNSFVYGSFVILIIGSLFLMKYNSGLVKFLLMLLVPIPIFVKIYGMYNTQQADLDVTTSLEINVEKIWIGAEGYLWRDIKDINLHYSDYEGLTTYRSRGDYRPNFSAGIDNFIAFETVNGEKIEHKFKLCSPLQIDDLKKVIEEVAANGYLPYDKVVRIYQAESHEDAQKLKDIYNSKIVGKG